MPYATLGIHPTPKFRLLPPPPHLKNRRAAVNNTLRAPVVLMGSTRAILAWANDVHPGSPAPRTPSSGNPPSGVSFPRSPSFGSSPLLRASRHSPLDRADPSRQSWGFIKNRIPFASSPEAEVDLAAYGYAQTPTTPEIQKPNANNLKSTLPKKQRTHPGTSPGPLKRKREFHADRLSRAVKQEAQMRRTADERSNGSSIRKVMEEEALREGSTVEVNVIDGARALEGAGVPYLDELGGIWWEDEDESEFAPQSTPAEMPLSAQYPDAEGWVTYNALKEFDREDSSELSSPLNKGTDSYRAHPLLVTNESTGKPSRDAPRPSSVAGSIIVPSPSKSSGVLLAVPSRPNRGRALKAGFLEDVFTVPSTPSSPSVYSQSSDSPRSPARATQLTPDTSAKPESNSSQGGGSHSPSRKERKPAPAPLKIPVYPRNKLPVNPSPAEGGDKVVLRGFSKQRSYTVTSNKSIETNSSGDDQASDITGTSKRSRRQGGIFLKGERIL